MAVVSGSSITLEWMLSTEGKVSCLSVLSATKIQVRGRHAVLVTRVVLIGRRGDAGAGGNESEPKGVMTDGRVQANTTPVSEVPLRSTETALYWESGRGGKELWTMVAMGWTGEMRAMAA